MKFFNQITGEHVIPADWQLQLKPGDYFIVEQPIMGIIGEQGRQCIMDATRQITKEEFEQARKRDWK